MRTSLLDTLTGPDSKEQEATPDLPQEPDPDLHGLLFFFPLEAKGSVEFQGSCSEARLRVLWNKLSRGVDSAVLGIEEAKNPEDPSFAADLMERMAREMIPREMLPSLRS